MLFRAATPEDVAEWLGLALALWPHADENELRQLYIDRFKSVSYYTIFATLEEGEPIAFIDLSLRTDYVEGSNSSPVGYVEGIYVKPAYRMQRIASELLQMGEAWSRDNGCSEFASDTELANVESQEFHMRYGFEEAERTVHFIKKL